MPRILVDLLHLPLSTLLWLVIFQITLNFIRSCTQFNSSHLHFLVLFAMPNLLSDSYVNKPSPNIYQKFRRRQSQTGKAMRHPMSVKSASVDTQCLRCYNSIGAADAAGNPILTIWVTQLNWKWIMGPCSCLTAYGLDRVTKITRISHQTND